MSSVAERIKTDEIDGIRTGILVVDIPSAADIPRFAEPWFLAFDAKIGFHPTMVPAHLEQAGSAIAAAVQTYG